LGEICHSLKLTTRAGCTNKIEMTEVKKSFKKLKYQNPKSKGAFITAE
jgi:hypothetical protein